VIDGQTNQVITTVPVGAEPDALCYNPANNQVYCGTYQGNSVVVIDGAADTIVASVPAGPAFALSFNPQNNKIYCAHSAANSVVVIDGATNGVFRTIAVDTLPLAFTYNPQQNRTYVANYSAGTVSVLRDSSSGVEERLVPSRSSVTLNPTIVRGVLHLSRDARSGGEATPSAVSRQPIALLDISGRKLLDLHPGANDVGRLVPGIYFVRSADGGRRSATKIVIQG
jgi:YVTN family beta-propeller protein